MRGFQDADLGEIEALTAPTPEEATARDLAGMCAAAPVPGAEAEAGARPCPGTHWRRGLATGL